MRDPAPERKALARSGRWVVEAVSGSAQQLHDLAADFSEPLVRINAVSAPAIVLASTQERSILDEEIVARTGFEVAKRRSGGGLVHLVPGDQVWIDFFVPSDDSLWVDDVSHSADWLQAAWIAALNKCGLNDLEPSRAGWSDPDLGRLACFAATGPGEVCQAGRKLVGISQRRTRDGARFQCIVYVEFDPSALLAMIDSDRVRGDMMRRLERVLYNEVASLVDSGWEAGAAVGRGTPGSGEAICLIEDLPGTLLSSLLSAVS